MLRGKTNHKSVKGWNWFEVRDWEVWGVRVHIARFSTWTLGIVVHRRFLECEKLNARDLICRDISHCGSQFQKYRR